MPKKTGSSRRCDASTPTCAIVGDVGWRPGRPGSVEAQPRPWHRPNERPPAAGQDRGDPAVVGPLGEADPPARRLMTGAAPKRLTETATEERMYLILIILILILLFGGGFGYHRWGYGGGIGIGGILLIILVIFLLLGRGGLWFFGIS